MTDQLTAKSSLLIIAITLLTLSTEGLKNGVHTEDIIEFVFGVLLIILREFIKNENNK